jgi:hypothetical protein
MKQHAARGIPLLLFTLLIIMPLAWDSASYAQAGPQGSAPTTGSLQHIQGVIQSVDPSGRMFTLDDGTELTIPPTVDVPREILQEWAIVKASFEERAGQKVVTSLEVQQLEVEQ